MAKEGRDRPSYLKPSNIVFLLAGVTGVAALALTLSFLIGANPPGSPSAATMLASTSTVATTNTRTTTLVGTPTSTATPIASSTLTGTAIDTPTAEPTSTPTSTTAPIVISTPIPIAMVTIPFSGVSEYGEISGNATARGLAVEAGVQWVRTSVSWAAIEPDNTDLANNPGSGNWPDTGLTNLTDVGLTPLALILNNPSWAASTPCGPVDRVSLDEFAQFVGALAERYDGDGFRDAPGSPQVNYWALHNEVDNADYPSFSSGGCWGADMDEDGIPDYQEYAETLRVAWSALHDANPQAKLVTGALAHDGYSYEGGHFRDGFLDDLLTYMENHPLPGGQEYFDLLSFNYYRLYQEAISRYEAWGRGIIGKAGCIQGKMDDYGFGDKPLLCSESGVSSSDDPGDPYANLGLDGQAKYLPRLFVRGMKAGLTAVIWWSYVDVEAWEYGILRTGFDPKPSYWAYQTMTSELVGYGYHRELTGVSGVEGHVFTASPTEKGKTDCTVLWTESPGTVKTVSFVGETVRVVYMDEEHPELKWAERTIEDGSADDQDYRTDWIGIQVGDSPVFVGKP